MTTATATPSFGGVALFGFRLSQTGLAPAKASQPPQYDDWEQLGGYLRWMDGSMQWLIGDWITYGEAHFHEKASQAIDATQWKEATVKQCAWVATKIPAARREPDLSWSHHREVADLAPTDQARWLKHAKRDSLSVERLRHAIHDEREPMKTECWLVVSCKNASDREQLAARLQAEGRTVKL